MVSFTVSCSKNNIDVFSVYDGDTFTDINRKKIRIFGIDAPEIRGAIGVKKIFAIKARDFLNQLLIKRDIRILELSIGYYGRSVCKVWSGQQDVAISLLKKGFAIVKYVSINPKNRFYSTDFKYYKLLLDAQHYAFKNKVGVWSQKELLKKIFNKR